MRHLWELLALIGSVLLWWAAEWAGVKLWVAIGLGVGWVAYFVRRGHWRAWGFRMDTLRAGAKLHLGAALLVLVAMAAFAAWQGTLAMPVGAVLVLYPLWAIGQQFILQHVVIGAAREVGVPTAWLPLVGAVGFGAAHAPDPGLMALTAAGGALWTWLFLRVQNLWTLGLAHALVGTAAFGWVLGRDPVDEFPILASLT